MHCDKKKRRRYLPKRIVKILNIFLAKEIRKNIEIRFIAINIYFINNIILLIQFYT